jgi:hypothetical protein
MSRVKSGVVTHARHRKVIKKAKGYYAARSTNFRTATQAVDKAMQYATRDRKNRKRNFRALWIQRINAAVRAIDESRALSTPSASPGSKSTARFWPIWRCMSPPPSAPSSKRRRPRSRNSSARGTAGTPRVPAGLRGVFSWCLAMTGCCG